MDQILANLSDSSWWFTGLFFIGVALILPSILRLLGKGARRWWRRRLAVESRRIKVLRRDDLLVQHEMMKAQSYRVVFSLLASIGLCVYVMLSAILLLGGVSKVWIGLLSIPLFIIEILWLKQRDFVEDLLRNRRNLLKKKALWETVGLGAVAVKKVDPEIAK